MSGDVRVMGRAAASCRNGSACAGGRQRIFSYVADCYYYRSRVPAIQSMPYAEGGDAETSLSAGRLRSCTLVAEPAEHQAEVGSLRCMHEFYGTRLLDARFSLSSFSTPWSTVARVSGRESCRWRPDGPASGVRYPLRDGWGDRAEIREAPPQRLHSDPRR